MDDRFNYLNSFTILPVDIIWEQEFIPILNSLPEIGERCKVNMESWVEKMRESDPGFAIGLEFPIEFGAHKNPLKLQFYDDPYHDRPRFDDDEPFGPWDISYWRSYRSRFLFSKLWLEFCEIWMPEGNWLRLDSEFHSILLETKSRSIFDPEFYGKCSAKYSLNTLLIGEPVKTKNCELTSNIIAWLNYHLKWHSRYNLPEVFEKALQHDLPEYLQIMQMFSDIEMPPLKATPLNRAQLEELKAMPAPVNGRMI